MGDTKLYSTQNIERLKQKIAVYRETLTTLKKGTSIEEFLTKKEEFDGFKIQIAHLEGLAKTVDENQGTPFDGGYGEKVKQIANQIDILSQTVDEMNQEISLLLKKDLKVEMDDPPNVNSNQSTENPPSFFTIQAFKNHEEIPQVKEPFLLKNNSPSYMQLQKLAGLARSTKPEDFIDKPVASNPTTQNPPEERHFNHQYFQSIGTHPSHMYNGLYKNISNTSSFHFKNESSVHEIPIYKNEPTQNPPIDIASEASSSIVQIVDEVDRNNSTAEEIVDSTVPIVEDSENSMMIAEKIDHPTVQIIDQMESTTTKANEIVISVVPIIDEPINSNLIAEKINISAAPKANDVEIMNTIIEATDHSAAPIDDDIACVVAVVEEFHEVPLELTIEETGDQTESSEINVIQGEPLNDLDLNEAEPEEHKKDGFSSFLNLFRRRN
ncbi:hypothetical protein [Solibacillus sp. FSL K6-1523]|uniref:hypothetical protein n=1 Tax=Solibacillus sp. FSL K6-1523 TaxID=2921471 RepID=UPI0030FAD9F2